MKCDCNLPHNPTPPTLSGLAIAGFILAAAVVFWVAFA